MDLSQALLLFACGLCFPLVFFQWLSLDSGFNEPVKLVNAALVRRNFGPMAFIK